MKRIAITIVLMLLSISAFAQQWIDVVYLNNGSIIKGQILEQIPGQTVKIETANGSVFVFQAEQITRISKEKVDTDNRPAWENNIAISYDLSTLKIVPDEKGINKYVVKNDRGTVFDRELLAEVIGHETAYEIYNELDLAAKTFNIPFFLTLIPEFGGGILLPLALLGVVDRDPWLGVSIACIGGALAAQIIGAAVSTGHRKNAERIVKDYRYSLYSVNVTPTLIPTYGIGGNTLSPGISICLNF